VWKKIQGDLSEGFNFMVEEFDWMDDYPSVEFPWSQREVTFTVDLDDDINVASIPDAGYRARPERRERRGSHVRAVQLQHHVHRVASGEVGGSGQDEPDREGTALPWREEGAGDGASDR
jgi:hypothetical protein